MVGVAELSLGAFLRQLGLQQYEPVFAKEDVSLEELRLLSEADLKGLGLTLGPRRKIQAALAEVAAAAGKGSEPYGHRRQMQSTGPERPLCAGMCICMCMCMCM